jgi:hypothetical protein
MPVTSAVMAESRRCPIQAVTKTLTFENALTECVAASGSAKRINRAERTGVS